MVRHYIFLGHSPIAHVDGLLWVRDPALPREVIDSVGRAGPAAWAALARAAGRAPEGPAAVVMLSTPRGARFGYHGDRVAGNMMRLSFSLADRTPSADDLETWGKFVAHETAHLWNHGVFASDPDRPWLHEGDAEWVALVAMHAARLLSDRRLVDELQARLDACLIVRGDRAAAALPPGRSHEDPYSCGVALQLLGFARAHARGATDPLTVWAALHRAAPQLDTAGFARFFDGDAAGAMRTLLLEPSTPFATTYRADLAAVLPLHEASGEPTAAASRAQLAFELMAQVDRADCGALGFSLDDAHGQFVLDASTHCKTLPASARVTTLAGVSPLTAPRAAWRAVQHACATADRLDVGIAGGAPVAATCPALGDLPPQALLPDDVLARLGL